MRIGILTLVGLLAVAATQARGGETLLIAKRIHTMDPAQPVATAMAWDEQGRIVAVGDAAALRQQFPVAQVQDAGNATVIPGLIDAHGHIADLGFSKLQADLVDAADQAEVLRRLRAFEQSLPPGSWLIGNGWDQNDWPQRALPTAADLDAAFPERPVWLRRIDGHAGWANSAAMRQVKRDLSGNWQPDGGRIERDRAGDATGVFVDAAMGLIDAVQPQADPATWRKALALGMDEAVKHGLTGVHDAGISKAQLDAYKQMADAGELPLRVTAMADGDREALAALCADGIYRHPNGRLQMRTVKLLVDGALGSRGAALLADYSDDPGNRGIVIIPPAKMLEISRKAKACGVQVATHAIGDAGNREVLDAYAEALGADAGKGDHRWRIEHAQVLAPQDLPRLAKLQVIASMQPTHATSDMPWAQDRLGAQRIRGAYAWQSLRDSGARLALGSDFPVESVDPRLGLYAAVTRSDAAGKPPGGWFPTQKMSAEQALRGFTLDAAYAGFAENEVGSLAIGKRADFVVLGEDPLGVPAAALRTLGIEATYVDGRAVYQRQPNE